MFVPLRCEAGADVNKAAGYGRTPLFLAALHGHVKAG